MPPSARRRRKVPVPRDAVRGEVLVATERLLRGGRRFTDLTVSDLAREAGVARSAFFVNFPEKADVLRQIAQGLVDEIDALGRRWLDADDLLSREALRGALRGALSTYREHAGVLRACDDAAGSDPALAEIWLGRLERMTSELTARIREGQAAGEFAPDLDPLHTAHFVVLGADRLLQRHADRTDPGDDDAIASSWSAFVARGLRPETD